jgi:hypothetical protein
MTSASIAAPNTTSGINKYRATLNSVHIDPAFLTPFFAAAHAHVSVVTYPFTGTTLLITALPCSTNVYTNTTDGLPTTKLTTNTSPFQKYFSFFTYSALASISFVLFHTILTWPSCLDEVVNGQSTMNSIMSTRPPQPGHNNMARPVPRTYGGVDVRVKVCATRVRMVRERMPMRALRM